MQEANKGPDGWFELKINTHVYITGLPEDVTIDEVRSRRVPSCCIFEHCFHRMLKFSVICCRLWKFFQNVE